MVPSEVIRHTSAFEASSSQKNALLVPLESQLDAIMQRLADTLGFTHAETVRGKLVAAGVVPVSIKLLVPSNCKFRPSVPSSQMTVPLIVPSFALDVISFAVVDEPPSVKGQNPTSPDDRLFVASRVRREAGYGLVKGMRYTVGE